MRRVALALLGIFLAGSAAAQVTSPPFGLYGAGGTVGTGTGVPGGATGATQYKVNGTTFGGYTPSGDVTVNTTTGAETLASIVSAAGPIGSATTIPIVTIDAKGRVTALSSATVAPPACTATAAGGVPTPPNDATKFLNGQCAFTVPAGGGGGFPSGTAGQIAGWAATGATGAAFSLLNGLASNTTNQTLGVTVPNKTVSANCATQRDNTGCTGLSGGDMGTVVGLTGSGHTLTLSAATATGNGMWQNGQSLTVVVGANSWTLTNSSTLTLQYCNFTTTLLPGTSVTFVADADGSHLDCVPGAQVATTSSLGSVMPDGTTITIANGVITATTGGSGCTVSGGAGVVLNNGASACTTDTNVQMSAGAISAGSSGVAGSVAMGNATSGTVTVQPVTGALGTVTASLPANTGTVAELNLAQTWTAAQNLSVTSTTVTQAAGDSSTDIATDAFVANAIAGVNPAVAVQAATTGALPAVTYNNGVSGVGATLTENSAAALTIDGYTPVLNDRLLIKNQASTFQNGVYTMTTVGTGVVPFVLTRALDFDQPSDMNSTGAIPVINGTANGSTQWVISSKVNTVGTDAVTFTQFSLNPTNIAQLNVNQSFTKGQAVTPTAMGTQSAGGTMTLDFSTSNNFTATFGAGNLTIANPTNVSSGECGFLELTQDGTGSRTVTWGANWKAAGGTAPTLSTAANANDLITFCAVDSTHVPYQLSIKGF